MAEQLILKGTLEGHVSCPYCCHFEQFPLGCRRAETASQSTDCS
jgi:hypothetical protein